MTASAQNQKFKAAMIGSGRICEQHMQYLSRKDARAEAVAICDLSATMVNFMADRFDIPAKFHDYRQMLEEVKPDVVHILTPPHTHVAIINDCLDAGVHVIAEKPVAPTREEFHSLWEKADDKGLWLVEDHNYRFNSPILEIDQLLASGQLGDVQEVEVRMNLGIRGKGGRYADTNLPHPSHNMPAGVIHEFLTHLCYLAMHFTPTTPDEPTKPFDYVRSSWANRGGGDLFKYDDLEATIASGPVRTKIRFDCHSKPDAFTVVVRGTEGTASTDLFQPHVYVSIPRKGPAALSPIFNQKANGKMLRKAAWNNFWDKVMGKSPYEGLYTFLDCTYAALAENGTAPVTFEDMDRTMELINALVDDANKFEDQSVKYATV